MNLHRAGYAPGRGRGHDRQMTSRPRTIWVALCLSLALSFAAAPSTRSPGTDPFAASAASAPRAATIVVDRGSARFSPGTVVLAGGGTLTLVNLDILDHTVTSVATDADG